MTRAHRVFDPDQIEFIANIVRLWRGEPVETDAGSGKRIKDAFPDCSYRNVPGLCRAVTLTDIVAQSWSLNPGRYVGVAPGEQSSDEEFRIRLEELQEELEALNQKAAVLQTQIAKNTAEFLNS